MSRDGFVAGRYGYMDARASGPGPFAIFHDPLLQFVLPGRPPPFGIDEYLRVSPPPLLEFDYRELFIAGIDGNIHGDLTSIVAVPEPARLALLAPLGLALVAIRRR